MTVYRTNQTHGPTTGLDHFLPSHPVCLALGSERTGVSQAVLDLADTAVTILMRGMTNSLNVTTAAAIVVHTIATRFQGIASIGGDHR